MFFIDDDETEVLQGREESAARADDDDGFSAVDLMPFIEAFACREVAMQDGDLPLAAGEAGFEAVDRLGSEGDLRNQDDGGAAFPQNVIDGLKVDFCFSAAGDSLEEDRAAEGGLFDGFEDVVQRGLLFIGENLGLGGNEEVGSVGIAFDLFVFEGDPTAGDEGADGGGRGQAGEGQRTGRSLQQ